MAENMCVNSENLEWKSKSLEQDPGPSVAAVGSEDMDLGAHVISHRPRLRFVHSRVNHPFKR